jgi:hypothetical protein
MHCIASLRDYVKTLVHGVPEGEQISFKTEADAYHYYLNKKAKGSVRAVRVSVADDDIFGPVDKAVE